mgnify:CR=1 FL=1
MDISIIVPLFNEEESLTELVRWIESVMDKEGYAELQAMYQSYYERLK